MSKLFKFLRIFSLFSHLLLNSCMYYTATDNINMAMYDPTDNDRYSSHRYSYVSMLVRLHFIVSVSIASSPYKNLIDIFTLFLSSSNITVYRDILFIIASVLVGDYKSWIVFVISYSPFDGYDCVFILTHHDPRWCHIHWIFVYFVFLYISSHIFGFLVLVFEYSNVKLWNLAH